MSSRHSNQDKKHRDDATSSRKASGSQKRQIPSDKGRNRSSHATEENPASSVPQNSPLDNIQYARTYTDSENYSRAPAQSLPDIGGLNLSHELQTQPRVTDEARSPIHPLCIVQCTRGWAIPNPAPRPQPTPPRNGDKQDYASYQKDLRRWEVEYETWRHFSCECKNAYYCKAHGQWVSGAYVRNRKSPPQWEQTPDTCHKLGYFCEAHKQWVSDEEVETGNSSSRRNQSSKTCHKDGYFCKAHGRWVPGDMIRLKVAPPHRYETPDTCHLFAGKQSIPQYAPPPDESCKSGNGKVSRQNDLPQAYSTPQSSVPYGPYAPASTYPSSTGYTPTYSSSSSSTYAPLAGTSTFDYDKQSPYLESGMSWYQGYPSSSNDRGNEQYLPSQTADAGPATSMKTSFSDESTIAPQYSMTHSAEHYNTATISNEPYYSTANPSQATIGQLRGADYTGVQYSSYPSYSNPAVYAQSHAGDQPAVDDHDTSRQEDLRRTTEQTKDRYESNSQASKKGKRKERR